MSTVFNLPPQFGSDAHGHGDDEIKRRGVDGTAGGVSCIQCDRGGIGKGECAAGAFEKERALLASLDHGHLELGKIQRPYHAGEAGAGSHVGNTTAAEVEHPGKLQALQHETLTGCHRLTLRYQAEGWIPLQHFREKVRKELGRAAVKSRN